MVTSDYPKMPASPQRLLRETRQVEAGHAEVQRKLDALERQYAAQEKAALANFDLKLKAVDAEFAAQRADITVQLAQSLRESVEAVLRQKMELEIDALRRTHQEQAAARKSAYEEQRRKYERELYTAISALMTAGSKPSPVRPPAVPSRPSEAAKHAGRVASGSPPAAETNPAPLAATEVPSQPRVAFPLPTPTKAPEETKKLPVLAQNDTSENAQIRPPQGFSVHSPVAPAVSLRQSGNGEQQAGHLVPSAAQSPAESTQSIASPIPIPGHESVSTEPACSLPVHDQGQPSPTSDPAHKRKANGEQIDPSPATTPNPAKRAKLDKPIRAISASAPQSPAAVPQPSEERTVSFEEVYGAPGRPAPYKHVIVRYPVGTGEFYILRCDDHGVHFGEHPLRGAAKHLASAQHGYMSKAHATAIETLGHRVLGCTQQLAEQNNHAVLKAFKDGYKAFNANNLSQAKRAELGFPPLDPLAAQKAATQRKLTAGVTDPVPCRFYVCSGGELRFPVLILPWGDISPAGMVGTLADLGVFREVTEDGRPLRVPKLPKCYVYDEDRGGRILGIRGWAKGYESGGPLERKREFPVLCVESQDYRMWYVGWVKAAQLSPLDFDDRSSRSVPFFREARGYFYNRIQRRHGLKSAGLREASARQGYGTSTPQRRDEDVHMRDAGDIHDTVMEGDSDRDSVSRAMTDSDRGIGRGDADSRRTSVSNRDDISGGVSTPAPAAPSAPLASDAQLIAAQALNLQGPPRSGFTAINAAAGSDNSAPPSARQSLEPPSTAGSASSSGGGHRRVFKIHARSSNRQPNQQAQQAQQTQPSPSIVLPERPAEGSMSPRGTQSQAQGEARRPSPASLQHILQDVSSPAAGAPRVGSPSPKPAAARRPLPSGPVRSGSPSRSALLSAVNAKLAQPLRDSRAGSAPVQPSQPREPLDNETRSFGSASAVPGLSRHTTPTPQPSTATPDPVPQKKPESLPQPTQLPPLGLTLAPILHLRTTPLATPRASASNTRANSPAPAQQPK